MKGGFRVVIPARFGASRFPGKPLVRIAGRSMIGHVFDRAKASGAAEIIVATDDERIAGEARECGAQVIMTRASHVSGTDRIAEVAALRAWPGDTIVVNLQGDSPLTPARSIRQVAALLAAHPDAALATLCVPVRSAADYTNPNIVKVVADRAGRALYFSRAPIPHGVPVQAGALEAWRHLGLYAYRVADLCRLAAEPPCALEQGERLEQLRALWIGMEIRIAPAEAMHGPDVDLPEDVARVEEFLRNHAIAVT